MFSGIRRRLRSDRGDSVVSAVIVVPLFIGIIFSGIDYGIYLGNRGQIQAVARDAARTAAIFGGAGTATRGTPIEKAYGVSRASACSGVTGSSNVAAAVSSTSSAVECKMAKTLMEHRGLVNVEVTSAKCTPQVATAVGQKVTCTIGWRYNGLPGSALSFFSTAGPLGDGSKLTSGTSESEVRFTTGDLVPRA